MKYQKANDSHSTRIVHTYGLVVKAMEWYLVGYCESRMDVRVFKCERITDAKILDETFKMPDGFSLESFWNQSSREFEKGRTNSEYYPVDIRLSKDDFYILRDFNVIKQSIGSDYINASVNLHSYDRAKDEVLDLIGWAEIIKPVELREFAVHKLESMLKMYR
jgi:predicted DNA-binding transcriptional regulator YafY